MNYYIYIYNTNYNYVNLTTKIIKTTNAVPTISYILSNTYN